ncbi:DUF3825 domain-containing protein [Luxibacter massiliensis]
MMLLPDLFSFAYVPNWYSQLDMLAEMALPEPWRFKNPIYLTKNPDTPILERYIHAIFKKQLIDYKEERIPSNAAEHFHIENEYCCFHTGLYTRRYKDIFACFDRNKKKDSMLEWYFRDFADELSPQLHLPMEETMLMPFGLLMDLWECHKQFMGLAKPKQELNIDDIIPYGI